MLLVKSMQALADIAGELRMTGDIPYAERIKDVIMDEIEMSDIQLSEGILADIEKRMNG